MAAGKIRDSDCPALSDRMKDELLPPPWATGPNWRAIGIKLLAVLLVTAGLAALWRYTPLATYVNPREMIVRVREFASHPWAPLLIVAIYTPATLIMFPWHLITLAAIVVFGPLPGAAIALGGTLLASLATYALGRYLPGHGVRHVAGHRISHIAGVLRRHGLLAVTALRLLPLAPFMVLGLVAGALRIKLWQFMLGSFIGLLPGTLAASVFGKEIANALQDPATIRYLPIAGIVLALIALSLLVRRWLLADSRSSREEKP